MTFHASLHSLSPFRFACPNPQRADSELSLRTGVVFSSDEDPLRLPTITTVSHPTATRLNRQKGVCVVITGKELVPPPPTGLQTADRGPER